MRDLKPLREGWDEIDREEQRLAQSLTTEQSLSIFVSLCESMASQIKETEELFRPEREAYLIELQSRLRSLETWRQEHGYTSQPG